MAYKGYLKDKENTNDVIHSLLLGMRGIMVVQGGKPGKLPQPKRLVRQPYSEKLPSLNDILTALGGSGVVVES